MSFRVARHIEIERAIVERLVSDALFFHGYTVSHSDGETSNRRALARHRTHHGAASFPRRGESDVP